MALLAVSRPSTSPRFLANQRPATVAPNTMAIIPVPDPTTTPQSSTNCQGDRMAAVAATPMASTASAVTTVRRRPNRSMMATAKGPIMP